MENRRFDKTLPVVGWLGDQSTMRLYLLSKKWMSPWGPLKLVNAVTRAIGVVAFANNFLTGAIILAAMFVGDVNVGCAALLAGGIGLLTSKLLYADDTLICDGITIFNGVLTACVSTAVVPSILDIEVDVYFWAALSVALVMTCVVDQGLNALMAPTSLPAQSMAFNLVVAIAYLAARVKMVGFHLETIDSDMKNDTDIDWLKVVEGSILSAGQVYGVGTWTPSIFIWIAFFVYSPLLTVCFYIGSVIGSICGLFLGPLSEVYIGLWSYNSLLTAGGLSYFLQPSPALLPTVCIGAFMTVMLQAAILPLYLTTQVPVMSYPFNVVITLILPIGTQKGRCIKYLPERSYPEHHAYLYCKNRKFDEEENGEVATNLRYNY